MVQTSSLKDRIWLFLEEPGSSTYAKIYSYLMSLIILLSVIAVLLQSVPRYEASNALQVIHLLVNVIFTVDVLLRLSVTPKISRFFFSFYNIVDFIVIIPFYVGLIVSIRKGSVWELVLLVQPILRLLKITRNFSGFRLLVKSLALSAESLPVPLFLLMVMAVTSAALIYFFESRASVNNPGIKSIPDAMWFSIVTIATVGYGDVVPLSTEGKIVASILIAMSILYMSMPLSIVGSNFTQVWNDRDRILLIEKTRQRLRELGFSHGDVKNAFVAFDTDGSGDIEASEFTQIIAEMKLGLSEDRIIDLFQLFDEDQSGAISFAEFAKSMFPDQIFTDEELKLQEDEIFKRAKVGTKVPDRSPQQPGSPASPTSSKRQGLAGVFGLVHGSKSSISLSNDVAMVGGTNSSRSSGDRELSYNINEMVKALVNARLLDIERSISCPP
jgi:voltage-gated potassium channel Kch